MSFVNKVKAISGRTWVGILLIGCLCIFIAAFLYSANSSSKKTGISSNALYASQFVDLDNKPITIGRWEGKLLLINFWASWCGPCKIEIPHLIAAQKSLSNKNIQVLGIAVDTLEKAKFASKQLGINYPVLVNQDGAIALSQRLGNKLGVLPFTVLVDQEGKVKFVEVGILTEKKIQDLLNSLL